MTEAQAESMRRRIVQLVEERDALRERLTTLERLVLAAADVAANPARVK